LGIFLVSRKLDTFCYLTGANCTVPRHPTVVLTQYQRVTDGQTDGWNCYSYYSACML